MKINLDADLRSVAKRLAESGKKVIHLCKHSNPEKTEDASVAQSAQQRTCNAPFTSSTLVAGSTFDHLPEGSY